MRQQNMVEPGDLIVTALSGGKDSVCLLTVLAALREELDFSLCALHVHHGIRGEEADRDALFCEELCRRRQIPFEIARVDVPAMAAAQRLSVEAAARKARYEALEAYRRRVGASRIAVAHHQDDQAETVLWNLFRGSGLRGIGGMSPVNGAVIRPFLGITREQLDHYARENSLDWCEDSTNGEDRYTRNRIRRHLMPMICGEVNGQAVEHICRTAVLAAEADSYLRRGALRWMEQPGHSEVIPETARSHAVLALDGAALSGEDRLLRSYVIREACRRLGCTADLTSAHVEAVQSLLTEARGGSAVRQVTLVQGIQVRREYDRLLFGQGEAALTDLTDHPEGGEEEICLPLQDWEMNRVYEVRWGGKTFKLRLIAYNNSEKFPLNRYTKWLNYDKMSGSLVLRRRKTGDYIRLSGGGTKTVKAYMVDEKIPAGSRDTVPVLADGHHVLWIVGYRISEESKVDRDTRRVLEITMYGGEKDGDSSRVDFGAGCEPPDR